MHELAVTESILEIALRHAAAAQAQKITALYLVIGQMASIVDESVQFYWDIISDSTPAEGAQLHFERIPTRLECQVCKVQFAPDGLAFECPECGSVEIRILAGEEFYLAAIDVESG